MTLWNFVWEKRSNNPKKVLLSLTFLVSRLLKYSFLVVLKSFLQKLPCELWLLSVCQGFRFQILILNLDCFIISLYNFLVIKSVSFSQIYFFLIKAYVLKTERIASLKLFISNLSNLQVLMSTWNIS